MTAKEDAVGVGALPQSTRRALTPNSSELDFSYYGGAESLLDGRSPRRTTVVAPTEKDNGVSHVAPPRDPSDFLWIMTEEPHRSRRMAIMKAHPEVRRLLTGMHGSRRVELLAKGHQAHGL